jgi:hypothetical protein
MYPDAIDQFNYINEIRYVGKESARIIGKSEKGRPECPGSRKRTRKSANTGVDKQSTGQPAQMSKPLGASSVFHKTTPGLAGPARAARAALAAQAAWAAGDAGDRLGIF